MPTGDGESRGPGWINGTHDWTDLYVEGFRSAGGWMAKRKVVPARIADWLGLPDSAATKGKSPAYWLGHVAAIVTFPAFPIWYLLRRPR